MLSDGRALGYNLVALRRYSGAPTYLKDSVAMSIDLETHVPSVFSLIPGREDALDELLSHVLP